MLMDTELDITQEDYVRTAQASGKALVSLINEVLDQAKIESGKLELEAVQFELRTILDDVLSLFYGKSQEKGIEVNDKKSRYPVSIMVHISVLHSDILFFMFAGVVGSVCI